MQTSTNEIHLNLDKICRICLKEHEEMYEIFTKTNPLAEKIIYITSIPLKPTDGLPQQICTTCSNLVETTHNFKLKFVETHKFLKQYHKDTQKFLQEQDSPQHFQEEAPPIKTRRLKHEELDYELPRTRRRIAKTIELVEEETFEVKHPCPICILEFNFVDLKEHVKSHKALNKYLSLPSHLRVSTKARFYKDSNCDQGRVSIHNREKRLHQCVRCNLEFTASDLQKHIQKHKEDKEYKCNECDRVFKRLNHLNTHKVKHLKEFPFKCEYCSKGFVIETNYNCHVLTHKNLELPHECPHCLKRFSNPEHLNRHIIIHTENVTYSVKYRVFRCHHCLKTFKDRDELKSHPCNRIQTQNQSSKHPCKICNKVFKSGSGLYNHNRNIHKSKSTKILCSVCGKKVSNIYNHMLRHSGEKPFVCNQCGKRFGGKPQLKQHLLVHSGLKPYVCSVCAKAFNNLYNLQVHERIHKGDRCHVCTVCGKGFLEKSYLKKHMQVHAKVR